MLPHFYETSPSNALVSRNSIVHAYTLLCFLFFPVHTTAAPSLYHPVFRQYSAATFVHTTAVCSRLFLFPLLPLLLAFFFDRSLFLRLLHILDRNHTTRVPPTVIDIRRNSSNVFIRIRLW